MGAELIWLDFDDEFLIDSVEARHKFIEAFRVARPDVVFCHWVEDYNPDHSISGQIVDECIHMATVPNIETESAPCERIPHVYFMDTIAGGIIHTGFVRSPDVRRIQERRSVGH